MKGGQEFAVVVSYIFILLNSIVIKAGDAADTAFANSLSLDTICVFAILASIKNTLYAIHEYGAYYFRISGNKAKSGLVFAILSSSLCAMPLLLFSSFVKQIFHVEPQQEELLRTCVRITFSYFPFEAACEYLRNYMIYSGMEKHANISNIIYYVFLLILDSIAVLKFHSAEYVLWGTGICCVVYAVTVYYFTGIGKDRFHAKDLCIILKEGFSFFISRMLSKVCILLINIIASKLGTVTYATISVCRKSLEVAQMGFYPMQPMLVVKLRDKDHTYHDIFSTVKPVLKTGVAAFLVLGYIILFFARGNLSFTSLLFPATASSLTSMVTYFLHVCTESKVILDNHQNVMLKSGIIRILTTAVLCMAGMISPWGWGALLFYSTITDLAVAAYAYRKTKSDVRAKEQYLTV